MRYALAALSLLIASQAQAVDLPGSLGPVRYFASLDDGTRILMIDWTLDAKVQALLQLTNSSAPVNGSVFAYKKRDQTTYVSAGHATTLAFEQTDNDTLHAGTSRKLWLLYGTRDRSDQSVRYVELQPPEGTPNAQLLINAYIEHEGGDVTDEAAAQTAMTAEIASACGNKPKITVAGLGKDGLLGKARAAAAGIADLCRMDADYKMALAKLSALTFERGKDDLVITKKGNDARIGVTNASLNTRESTLQWFKDNL